MRRAAVVIQAAVRMQRHRGHLHQVGWEHAYCTCILYIHIVHTCGAYWSTIIVMLTFTHNGLISHPILPTPIQAQQAATIIQSAWRMHTARYQFHTQRSAAVTIQATWRAHVQHTRYITCKAAAVVMQAMWRGRQVRGTLERQHAAAIVVQRHVRGWTTRRWYDEGGFVLLLLYGKCTYTLYIHNVHTHCIYMAYIYMAQYMK